MGKKLHHLVLVLAASLTGVIARAEEDPYLWLEKVENEQALAWVRARNAESKAFLEGSPGFEQLRGDLRAIYDSDAKIPYVEKIGGHYYNLWKDARHERGLWRRTTLDEYRKAEPAWETVLDLDALGKAEGVAWVWKGSEALRPDFRRCLIELSRGGADATVTREFDLVDKAFVKGGFERPEAKGGLSWKDADTVYANTDFGPGSMTSSGYPRTVREWKRGTPMTTAPLVYEGRADDLGTWGYRDQSPGFARDFVNRVLAFYNDELYLRSAGGELRKIDAPNDTKKSVHHEWLLLETRTPWTVGGQTYPAGALLAARFDGFMAGERKFAVLFTPTETTSLEGYSWTRDHLILNVLDDVKNRLFLLSPKEADWQHETLRGTPALGTVSATGIDADESNAYFMTVTDFLTPTSLGYGEIGQEPVTLKQTPAFFDATGLAISQYFAPSADGTRVPYFMVARKDTVMNGRNPTLLEGYGGFEISMVPWYSATTGRAWLSLGGVYVVANIHGGGEYGPRWHQAALKAGRHKAYEDFAAVARDLVSRGVTAPAQLGITGASNGGLLMGNLTVMYPGLFGAVVCQVPLLDMKRYHLLLAGASWMAEYGNPDTDDWNFLQKYSPYQNVRAGVKYPPVLFTSSTRDDRVHPGHARKMMARMKEQGHAVSYYENIEGGHGGAANNEQAAYMQAIAFSFLRQHLFPPAPPVRPPMPTRLPDGPGAPAFKVAGAKPGDTALRAGPGANPPVEAEGDWLVGPDYVLAPELTVIAGVPQGRVEQFELDSADSKFYPGIARDAFGTADPANPLTLILKTHPAPYKRTITVYIPNQYVPGTAAPFIVTHDGPQLGKPDLNLPHILDNLIAQRRVPAMLAIMIANGGGDAQGSERGLEYDTMSGKFAEFIQAEVLPAVEKNCHVTLTQDPDGRAAMGGSSGAAAAFIMAWYHPEWYHRVIGYSCTFVNQQWPFNPGTPGGAWDFHDKLVPQSPVKPIRFWTHVSDRDLYNPNIMRDGMHDWVEANHRMAAALKARGYHYQYVFSLNSGHTDRKVREQTLPEALEWVWRGYPITAPVAAHTSALEVITLSTLERQVAHRSAGRMESPHFSPDGAALYFNHEGRIKRLNLAAPAAAVVLDTGLLTRCNNDHGLSPDGTQLVVSDLTETGKSLMYLLPVGGGTPKRIAASEPSYWHAWSPDGKTLAYCGGREGNYDVYTIPVAGGPETRLTTAPGNDNGPDYSADGQWIYFHSNRTGRMQVWRMHPDGSAQEQVTSDANYNWFPHPSPDGQWIVYLSTPTVPDTGHPSDTDYVLRLIPAAGGAPRDIAKFFGGQGSLNIPCWSRDSTRLAFMSIDPAP